MPPDPLVSYIHIYIFSKNMVNSNVWVAMFFLLHPLIFPYTQYIYIYIYMYVCTSIITALHVFYRCLGYPYTYIHAPAPLLYFVITPPYHPAIYIQYMHQIYMHTYLVRQSFTVILKLPPKNSNPR